MPDVVVDLGTPHTPLHLPPLPHFGNRTTKLITAGAAIIISLSMVSFTIFSILSNNNDFKKSHGITSPTDNLESSNTTTKSDAALPGGGVATGIGGTTGTNSPVVTLTAQPASVPVGSKTHLKWSVTNNPKSCSASDDWSGTKNASGEEDTATLTKLQTYIFTLTCKTDTGTGFATVSVGAVQQGGTGNIATRPTVHLAANPSSVYQGQDSTLTWEATNDPSTCTASGDWSGAKSPTGTVSTGALSTVKTYSYTLTCSNSAGSGFATATVAATELPPDIPVVSLDMNPVGPITPGNSVTLGWTTVNNPSTCTASGDWSGAKSISGGSQSVGPLTAIKNYTFTLTCNNSTGSAFDSVVLSVLPSAPSISLTVNPSSLLVNNSATITWSATNSPTSCTASSTPNNANWSGNKASSGSVSTGALGSAGTYYFSLSCTNAGGTGNANNVAVTVTNPPPPVVSLSASPISISAGGSASLSWSATNSPTSCTASSTPNNANWSGNKASSGSVSTGALGNAGTYTYSLTCNNAGGSGSASTSVSVNSGGASSPPVVSISLSPTSVGVGGSSTVTWSATNSPTSCTASGTTGTWVNSPAANGSASTGIMNTAGTYTYTLTCTNSAGQGSKSATLTVIATPVVTISVSPSTITTGSNSTVTWSATNSPTSCTASGNSYWSGSKSSAGGSQQVGPITTAGPYTFSMTCSNAGGAGSLASTTLTVNNAVYCSGNTPCYGPNDLISHNTVANCWGYNIAQVFDITSFNNGFHKSSGPRTNLLPNSTSPLCGNVSIAPYLSGTSLTGVGSHNHQTSTKNNTNATLAAYRVGYYDASKP